jgi:hypothetical protein
MVESESKSPIPADQEQQVWEAVAFFEKMLQTMPDDRVSLEVLAQAYEHAGDLSRACELLVRLAGVAMREGDQETAATLRARLAAFVGNASASAMRDKLSAFLAAAPPVGTAPGPATMAQSAVQAGQLITEPAHRRAIVTQELDFAWLLHQQNLLSEEQYASIVSDLTELSASATPAPVSVLHLFQDRQLPNIDRVLAFAAEKSGLTFLPLGSFDPQPAAYELLPTDYLLVKGVLPFERMSADLLVGTLTPFNESLRRELATLTGRRCHFFLIQPADFDQAFDKIRKLKSAPAKPVK